MMIITRKEGNKPKRQGISSDLRVLMEHDVGSFLILYNMDEILCEGRPDLSMISEVDRRKLYAN